MSVVFEVYDSFFERSVTATQKRWSTIIFSCFSFPFFLSCSCFLIFFSFLVSSCLLFVILALFLPLVTRLATRRACFSVRHLGSAPKPIPEPSKFCLLVFRCSCWGSEICGNHTGNLLGIWCCLENLARTERKGVHCLVGEADKCSVVDCIAGPKRGESVFANVSRLTEIDKVFPDVYSGNFQGRGGDESTCRSVFV